MHTSANRMKRPDTAIFIWFAAAIAVYNSRYKISWERLRVGCISLEPVSPGIKTLSSLLKFYQHLLRSLHCEKSCKISAQPPTLSCIEFLDNMAKTIDCLCFRTVNDYANLFFQQPTRQECLCLASCIQKIPLFWSKRSTLTVYVGQS